TALLNESPSLSIVVMSLNRIPGFGKSGMSRMRSPSSFGAITATGERLAEALEVERRVVVRHTFALHVVEPRRPVDRRMVGAGDRPRIAAIGPARRMQALRVLEVLRRERTLAGRVEVLREREVRCGGGLACRSRPAAADHLVR